MPISGSTDSGGLSRTITSSIPVLRCRNGNTFAIPWIQPGAPSIGKNEPDRNAMGIVMRLAMALAASVDLAFAPASSPIDMNASVPHRISGIAIHHEWDSLRPKYGSDAMAMKMTICTSAIPTATTIRAPITAGTFTGERVSRRRIFFCRQVTSVAAAPKVAPIAMAYPRMPGVKYWIGLSALSSTCSACTENRGGWPLAARLALCTSDSTTPRTVPAAVASACE